MTLPTSGSISFSSINTEVGAGASTSRSMDWVRNNTKDGAKTMGALYSRAWYQKNNQTTAVYACNCTAGGLCNANCNDCTNCNCASNCNNCDAKPWLQPNCNCAATNCNYNCVCLANCSNCTYCAK